MTTTLEQQRSGIANENLQEVLDAENSAGQAQWGGQQQYLTPPEFAAECQRKLPSTSPSTILDPQVGGGALVALDRYSYSTRCGIDIDNRIESASFSINLITANIVKVGEVMADVCPDLRFVNINANPPFGKRWKLGEKSVDSTQYTWDFVTTYGNYGYFIANAKTIKELGYDKHPWTFKYEEVQALTLWKGLRPELMIGVVYWQRPNSQYTHTPNSALHAKWEQVKRIIDEEKSKRPAENIYLDPDGTLRTYLSVRKEVKLNLTHQQVTRLHRLNHCHPLTLTTEKETRQLMKELVECGTYTVQPAAKAAIMAAIAEVNALACPIMPVTPFETVAYADEEETMTCIAGVNDAHIKFTAGKRYPIVTGSYKFSEKFTRKKLHFTEDSGASYTMDHECSLSGNDRYIQVEDDRRTHVRFMDRPREGVHWEQPEKRLWEIFQKPAVQTVAELKAAAVAQNHAVLKSCELMSNYRYYDGQLTYLGRVATKDCGLVAAATGTGKTLAAISLIAMKGPDRALIVAPQGTMRSSENDDDDEEAEEFTASQWIQELNRFAPFLQVWELFSYEDYQRILSLNDGKLPSGVYVTYYEAFLSNGAMESAPKSWDDEKLNKWAASKGLGMLEPQSEKRFWVDTVGKEVNGIRCIIEPCLATKIGHEFDMIVVDECHRMCNLNANLTQAMIRLQPKYRWAMSATPIPNIVSNLFSLMGWLSVPDWYKGGVRNAAWPYARHEISRFNATFLTMERDFTQEAVNRKKDPKNRGAVVRESPIISSPARLLKLLKPTMAYLSKEQTNPNYIPPKVVDVRVPMGQEQSALYAHFMDRANIPCDHPLVRARKQAAYLRGICTDPKGFRHHTASSPVVTSNMNPKVIAILELVIDILQRGETAVIINSRTGISDTLQDKLTDAGVPIARIDSNVTAEQHAYQANLFKKGKAKCLLMGIKCAAAYSFDDCKNLIIGSLEYSFGPFEQAKGRIDRVTNKCVKNIYCILAKHSIEEVMYETVALKGDAACICLKGQRVPRDFMPVDAGELMASAFERFDCSGATPESQCEAQWPKLQQRITLALDKH